MDPLWKNPTRPCPFFAKGNCFFFERCNFLHEITTRNISPGSTSFDDDEHDEYQRGNGPVLQSRFSVDLDSSSEDEINSLYESDLDDEDSRVRSPSLSHVSPGPRRSLSPQNSVSSSNEKDAHIRDSVMTIKVQPLNFPQTNDFRATDVVGTRNLNGGRKQLRGPRLSLSIPHQFGSVRASHKLVVEDLKRTLKRDPSSSPPSANLSEVIQNAVINEYAQGKVVTRQRTGTLMPQPQEYRWRQEAQDDKIDNTDFRSTHDNPATISPLTHGSSVGHGSVDLSIGMSMELHESPNDILNDENFATNDTPESQHKPILTPSWLKPLRLPTVLNPQPDISKSQGLDQSNSRQPYSFSPVSLLAQYSQGSEDDDVTPPLVYTDPAKTDSYIPTNSPRTIVLSDAEDDFNSASISRTSSLNIDMTSFPPARSEPDDDGMSSTGSVTLSVLLGGSPKPSSEHGRKPPASPSSVNGRKPSVSPSSMNGRKLAASPSSVNGFNQGRASASPRMKDIRTVLEHRAQKIRGSVTILNLKKDDFKFLDSTSPKLSQIAERPDHAQQDNVSAGTPLIENSLQVQNVYRPPRSNKSLSPSPQQYPSRLSSTSRLSQNSISSHSSDPSYRPQLLFAIASDKPEMVENLLASGQSFVNEMADSGTDLLSFTVSNENLKHKTEIVKTLLKYGADPAVLTRHESQVSLQGPLKEEGKDSPVIMANGHMNAAMEYFLTRQSLDLDSKPTLQVLEQTSFAPLAKARFDIIGQDRVLDEFYRVIGLHSQRKSRNALVILLCGDSGHGKSYLAQKVGSLLNVPIHTINMTALRSQHDLWQCLSTGAEDASPNMDLADFLVENQGRRCVVVLDDVEKVDDPKALNPLLLPWDIGRCSLEQKKHTDTCQVIWIATSNLGKKLITEHVQQWKHPDGPPSRNEYIQLATAIRRSISEVLGAPLVSRITAILPFLPFTLREKKAIGTEAILSYQDLIPKSLSPEEIDRIVDRSVNDTNLVEEEGARSLYRVVEAHMLNFKEADNAI